MRTRGSPRNQATLWRALGGPVAKPAPVDQVDFLERLLAAMPADHRRRRQLEYDLRRAKMRRLGEETRHAP